MDENQAAEICLHLRESLANKSNALHTHTHTHLLGRLSVPLVLDAGGTCCHAFRHMTWQCRLMVYQTCAVGPGVLTKVLLQQCRCC
jgi:hypothetical protein